MYRLKSCGIRMAESKGVDIKPNKNGCEFHTPIEYFNDMDVPNDRK